MAAERQEVKLEDWAGGQRDGWYKGGLEQVRTGVGWGGTELWEHW